MTTAVTPFEALLVRGAMYQLLALGYVYPAAEQREQIQELTSQLEPVVGAIHPDWTERVRRLRELWDEAGEDALEAEWGRLFSGAVEAAPYESAYERDIFRKQHTMADSAGFYQAFGFQVPGGSRWQPDHVGVELEFCSIVLQRTAHALEQGWQERTGLCVDALRKFLQDHLGRWSDAFAADVQKMATLPFYQHLAEVTRLWVALEVEAQGLEPDRLKARKIYADDAELPTCGGCTGCGPDGVPLGDVPMGCPQSPPQPS